MTGRKLLIPPGRLAEIKSRVPMPALVAEGIAVQRAGRGEYLALCPFHTEQTPSFRVYQDHAHCFGCGWHGDQIAWLLEHARLGFLGAVHHLCNWAAITEPAGGDIELEPRRDECEWRPIHPIPSDAPPLVGGGGTTARIFNPKRSGERREWLLWRPALVHPYLSVAGKPLGYVLRIIARDGKKFTPIVTYCQNAAGERRWCIVPFARPAPLYRLDRLLASPTATVVLVEGEKTADAAARLLPSMVATTWPGGSKGYRHVDLSPLRGRKVVGIPDADRPGREAFHGRIDRHGKPVPGLVELLVGGGAAVQMVEPEASLPDGWDIADGEAEGWDAERALAWIKSRLTEAPHAA